VVQVMRLLTAIGAFTLLGWRDLLTPDSLMDGLFCEYPFGVQFGVLPSLSRQLSHVFLAVLSTAS
jgi:hypothetical protein